MIQLLGSPTMHREPDPFDHAAVGDVTAKAGSPASTGAWSDIPNLPTSSTF